MKIVPTSHEERTIAKCEVALSRYDDIRKCKKGDWLFEPNARNVTFNDVFITYLDHNGAYKYFDLSEWFLTIYTSDEPQKEICKQISLFEIIGE